MAVFDEGPQMIGVAVFVYAILRYMATPDASGTEVAREAA
jgi:hypothetical protein